MVEIPWQHLCRLSSAYLLAFRAQQLGQLGHVNRRNGRGSPFSDLNYSNFKIQIRKNFSSSVAQKISCGKIGLLVHRLNGWGPTIYNHSIIGGFAMPAIVKIR
jgi:hypothetical protein